MRATVFAEGLTPTPQTTKMSPKMSPKMSFPLFIYPTMYHFSRSPSFSPFLPPKAPSPSFRLRSLFPPSVLRSALLPILLFPSTAPPFPYLRQILHLLSPFIPSIINRKHIPTPTHKLSSSSLLPHSQSEPCLNLPALLIFHATS